MTVEGAIDPASSDSATADDNVVGCVGFYGPDVYVLDYSAEKGEMPDKTAAHFFEQVIRWRPLKFSVESVSFQRTLAWYIEQEMTKKRIFVPINRLQDRRRKNDRIIQAIAGILAHRRLFVKPSMQKLIQQLDDFDPSTDKNKDDVIDMLAMAIMSQNPMAFADENVIEQEMRRIDEEESQYEQLEWRGAP